MNELALFAGAGGGILGSKLLGHRIIGYVEYEPYCQEILKQRIADGILDAAPIFGDIRKFISDGYAASYSGMVDLISGGFPCQPFSVAGKQLGESDPRNMWPSTIECIRIIRPRLAFLENVAGLLRYKYFGRILGDLAECGYCVRCGVFSGHSVGAPFDGERLFFLASTNCLNGKERMGAFKNGKVEIQREPYRKMLRKVWLQTIERNAGSYHGLADYVDRGKAIGNGQVPLQMAYAFSILSRDLIK